VANLRRIFEYDYNEICGEITYSGPYEGWEQVIPLAGIPPIVSESGVRWRFQALRLSGDEAIMPSPGAQELAGGLHALISEFDATTDVDELLSKLADTERRIQDLVVGNNSSTNRESCCRPGNAISLQDAPDVTGSPVRYP